MALRADYEIIHFWEHLGDKEGDISTSATFVGNQTTVRNFFIGQAPYGPGYITLQLYDVHNAGHQIKINGVNLGGADIRKHAKSDNWYTWTDVIEGGKLKQGNNTVQIVRASGGDNLVVDSVIINWREFV
ncbi:MAG: DUF7383 domain-containing protein [Planctomycetota bacterium]|jgi:hypothetical protein